MLDSEIIYRAQKKDLGAMEEIYSHYNDYVWNVALKTSLDPAAADDISAETFIKVFRKIRSFRFSSKFSTWLYRITVNTALNYLRREKRHRNPQLNEETAVYEEKESPRDREERDQLETIMKKLRPEERMILTLREYSGLSYNEIAQAMKVKLSTAKVRVMRAREHFRKLYLENNGGVLK
jgi:RNA polymerase sigma-70 factor (ECF subfamily)